MFTRFLFLIFTLSSFSQISLSNQAKISILTCGTAEQSYAMYGHTAIRITDFNNGIDWVYNYGAFDFSTDYFILKFVKGDLQYFINKETFNDFDYIYKTTNRSIYEQELSISLLQKQELFNNLENQLNSPNRFYTYKFIDQNCTTMVVDQLNKICSNGKVVQTSSKLSYREILYPYMTNFYLKLGIQLLFGNKVDQPAKQLFLPLELKKSLEKVSWANKSKTLFEAQNANASSYFNTYITYGLILLLLFFVNKSFIQISYFIFSGILGTFIVLIGFYSLHEEVLYNPILLIFNPLLVLVAYFWNKKIEKKQIYLFQFILFLNLFYFVITMDKIHFYLIVPFILLHYIWIGKKIIKSKKLLSTHI